MIHLKRQKLISPTQIRGYNLLPGSAFRFHRHKGTRLRSEYLFSYQILMRYLNHGALYTPYMDSMSQSTAKIKLRASGFEKGTTAKLELYFRFRLGLWPIYSHRQVILHQPVKFRRNRTIGGEVMASYRFFKMAAREWEIYFRVRFWRWHSFGKMEIYWHTKIRWDIAIFIFRRFGLKLPIQGHFWRVWGHISPNDVTHRPIPTSFEP